MARRRRCKEPEEGGIDLRGLGATLERYLESMRVLGTSENTVESRAKVIGRFIAWCEEQAVRRPSEVTKPILERYQRHLYQYRQENGQPLSWASQYAHISSLRGYFMWLCKHNLIFIFILLLFNPASELSLPRRSQRLPMHPLSVEEVERVLAQPDVKDSLGLRDRAMLETFYSTGVRRSERAGLRRCDVDAGRGLLRVQLRKGRKDRVVPIGERALSWIDTYLCDARPSLVVLTDEDALFLGRDGGAISLEYLTELVHGYIEAVKLGKSGSCHLSRHTMATLMLEAGADLRYIQEILGHEELCSTQIYTRLSIRALKQVHSATHPARLERGASAKAALSSVSDEQEELLSSLAAEAEEEETDCEPHHRSGGRAAAGRPSVAGPRCARARASGRAARVAPLGTADKAALSAVAVGHGACIPEHDDLRRRRELVSSRRVLSTTRLMSPAESEGPGITGITGDRGPPRWF